MGDDAFQGCAKLTSVNFPAATTIGSYAFQKCTSLTSVSFPAVITINSQAFNACSSLTFVSFPTATSIGSYAFNGCTNLTSISFPAAKTIGGDAFRGCTKLSQFYLTGPSLCALSNSNVFRSTPYAGYSALFSGTPWIYVPASLVSAYQTATNWTYFSSYFSAIDPVETPMPENPIEFTIEGVKYLAEEGMTWGEWVESEYNTGNYIVDIENKIYKDPNWVWEGNGATEGIVYTDDEIEPSANYFLFDFPGF
jgi:hypothetical protein